jgi:hypothetical protein
MPPFLGRQLSGQSPLASAGSGPRHTAGQTEFDGQSVTRLLTRNDDRVKVQPDGLTEVYHTHGGGHAVQAETLRCGRQCVTNKGSGPQRSAGRSKWYMLGVTVGVTEGVQQCRLEGCCEWFVRLATLCHMPLLSYHTAVLKPSVC